MEFHVVSDFFVLVPALVDRFVASSVIPAVREQGCDFSDYFIDEIVGFWKDWV
jgi:hypothetical protein